ncbi:MAG: glycoside hydrolase family 71/99-like protein [Verrucomicrobiota bacterium]|nr:glycoside hydrolase family 71/99-like protein [Verrucomicrobiota bacterium]
MKSLSLTFCLAIFILAPTAKAQTKLKLFSVTPGTEKVELISNGDFQLQGLLVTNRHPFPEGWNRLGDVFADSGRNLVSANASVVASGDVSQGALVGQYSRAINLEPNTEYVFSGYLWNFGNVTDHVTTVIDLNDVPGEPQITLDAVDAKADQGYFVYRYFNTQNTGTNVLVRAFYDGFTGRGSASNYFPLAAQWDNLAITKASAFVLPQTNSLVSLQVTRSGDMVSILWPAAPLDLAPQFASTLSATSLWQNLTNAVLFTNNLNIMTLSNLSGAKFFRLVDAVDPSTMNQKLLMGYQGWFACPADGVVNGWRHWFRTQTPAVTNVTVDFWPDISELDPDELFTTGLTLSNGAPAKVFSSYKQKTVTRHFRWMRDNQLDGVFLQRFSSELADPNSFAGRNQVAASVRLGAEMHGRVFAIMYDISDQPASTLVSTLTNDWSYLVNNLKITSSPRYLRHKGKPVVAIWGFGFLDRPGTPAQAQIIINYFKAAGLTVMGGVPAYWRTLNSDSQTDPAWLAVYHSFDIISPWAVGRYSTLSGADNFKQNRIAPDLANTTLFGIEYMPVIFPGFSWHNLYGGPLNEIPRNGGTFYWRQVYNAQSAGCKMIYGAMFDELDEGTAMFKMAPTSAQLPAPGSFVPLNIDSQNLTSDWYLRLADQAGKMLRGKIPLGSQMPITP